MRISSRTVRRNDAFDRKLDALVTPILLDAGFKEARPYVFERHDAGGSDVIYFDVEGLSFLVQLAYRPNYMQELEQLFEHLRLPHDPNLGASSFFTPKWIVHKPREFPCKVAAARDRSLQMVAEGLRSHALAWLDSLRDPVRYAESVQPGATMYVGLANEVAGRLDLARAAYEGQMQRLLGCWDMLPFNKFVAFEGNREFVYLCLKLRRELDKCERVMDAIGFHPQVSALPDEV